ncbi:MAG: flagellar basal body-associated FliL family protein [Thalassovita sp.]
MTATDTVETEEKKASKLPMIIGLVLALVGGGGGYVAASMGLLPFIGAKEMAAEEHGQDESHDADNPLMSGNLSTSDTAFVPIDPLLISLGSNAKARHLRFRGQVETSAKYADEVQKLMPRIVDVLNSYLRAVEEKDLREPSALIRLRAQMLRRIQIVTGPGRVNDLLIMEFVLN